MHPRSITDHHLLQFGKPEIRQIFGQTLAYYEPGTVPGWKIARQLSDAGLLSVASQSVVRKNQPITPDDWTAIAKIEDIPAIGFRIPMVQDNLAALPRRSRIQDVTFDQDFTQTLHRVIESFALTVPGRAHVYPILDGPPGASKSLVAMVAATLLKVPIYTVTGSDGAADEIKVELLGGDNPNTKDRCGLIREYIRLGWLQHPLSMKAIAIAQQNYSLEGIPDKVLLEIAGYEMVKDNITYYSPGKFELMARHGGILFLDEINGFKGVTTILTQLLENYTVDFHPMSFIIGALNPAGEKHDRDPLPPEIRSRGNTIYVRPPTAASYNQMLQYAFSGEQPSITLPDGSSGSITPSMLGLSILPRPSSVLKQVLQTNSFNTLLKNLARFHKAIEDKCEDGILDPRESAIPKTDETTSIDRRTLNRLIATIDGFLQQSLDQAPLQSAMSQSWDEYQKKPITVALQRSDVISAVSRALQKIYVDALDFAIQEEVDTKSGKKEKFGRASEVVRVIMGLNQLSTDKLTEYIATVEDVGRLKDAWVKYLETLNLPTKNVNALTKQAVAASIHPSEHRNQYALLRRGEETVLLDVPYLRSRTERETYIATNYPGVSFKSSQSFLEAFLPKVEEQIAKKRLPIQMPDVKDGSGVHMVRDNGTALVNMFAAHDPKAIYIVPIENDSGLSLLICIPNKLLQKPASSTAIFQNQITKVRSSDSPVVKNTLTDFLTMAFLKHGAINFVDSTGIVIVEAYFSA